MPDEVNSATQSLEILKQSFETELKRMEEAGQNLLENHPRYTSQAQDMIDIARKKQLECLEDMFSLALGANFQSGKSTTVNAMSDGHVICPSGNGGGGIRTSSCAVRVNYGFSESSESESPTILWKTQDTLSRDLEYWSGEILSLKNPDEFRNSLKELALDMPEQLATNDQMIVDRMHQILLYMSYYDHPDVTQWKSQNRLPAETVLAFLAFPSDNRTRWFNVHSEIKRLNAPTPEEIRTIVRKYFYPTNAMYLFIEIVNFSTPSEYLRSLGITVIDTPGLNMSDNDTRVALNCMLEATSIFYFFNGESELGKDDIDALKLIDKLGVKDKVFFGVNFISPVDTKEEVRKSILIQLEEMGYTAPHQKELLLFNAFLAQRARQGNLILKNQLNNNDEFKILEEAHDIKSTSKDVKQAWIDTTANVMHRVGIMNEQRFKDMGLSPESIKLAYEASRWDDTMNFILDYVLENRSRLLLVERVAKPIESQLNVIEQVLLADETAAAQTADDLQRNYEDAISRYNDFQRECKEKLDERIKEDWDLFIAEDFYRNVYEQCPPGVAEAAVDKIKAQQTFLNNMGHLAAQALNKIINFFNGNKIESKLEKECSSIMKKSIEDTIDPLAIAWNVNFENGTTYQNTIRASVDYLHRDIMDIWKRRGLENNEHLKHLFIELQSKLPSGSFKVDSETIILPKNVWEDVLGRNITVGGAAKDTLKGILAGTIGANVVAYIYMFVLPLDFIVPFAAEIIAAIMLTITTLIAAFSRSDRKKREREQLKQGLQDELHKMFFNHDKREEIIENLIKGDKEKSPGTQMYRKFYRKAFEAAINGCGEILAAQARQAKEDADRGDTVRKRIAKEAKDIREGIIESLQQRMNALKNRVDALFPPRTA